MIIALGERIITACMSAKLHVLSNSSHEGHYPAVKLDLGQMSNKGVQGGMLLPEQLIDRVKEDQVLSSPHPRTADRHVSRYQKLLGVAAAVVGVSTQTR